MSILIKDVFHNNRIADVLIEGNKFVKIGHFTATADTVINGKDKAILPPFYNTHCHAAMSVLRGYGDGEPLSVWLNDYIWPMEAKLTEDDIYVASRLAILEMIKSGTVFFADMYYKPQATMQAVKEMGVRAAISMHELDNFDTKKTKEQIANTEKFLHEPNPCAERIIKCISCHSVYTVSEELFKYAAKVAQTNNLYLMVHASETKKEVDDCVAKYRMSPIERLDSFGILGKKTILAHAIHLSENDIALIKNSGCYISVNPTSNLKLNSGLIKFDRLYKDMPSQLTLGTDGAASNNNLSMIEAMKICSLVAKLEADSAMAGNPNDIYQVASANGAHAFGLNAGTITEGALADCILADLNNPALIPGYDLVSNMVYAADSSVIKDVVCNGKIIMKNGKVKNEHEIIRSALEITRKMYK